MSAFISHTTVDCRNAYELSEWWKQVLGYVDVPGDPNLPGHEACMIIRPDDGHRLHALAADRLPVLRGGGAQPRTAAARTARRPKHHARACALAPTHLALS